MIQLSLDRSLTAEKPISDHWSVHDYLLRNVMRKPKPMKIITCTSWNT